MAAQLPLDVGVADVHVPGSVTADKKQPNAPKGKKKNRYPKKKTGSAAPVLGYRLALRHSDNTRTIIQHTAASAESIPAFFNPNTNQLFTYLDLDKDQALSAGDADGRVWIQIARTGAWLGHPQGPFEITEQTLDALERNFYGQGVGKLQYDFNHASAFPPNSGTIPAIGTPSQGWAYGLRREPGKLFALTKWLSPAKEYLEQDKYGGVSPLINWKGLDRVTGKPIGPELRSIALTNLPFLLGMAAPTAASADGLTTEQRGFMTLSAADPSSANTHALGQYAYCRYTAAGLLPKLKQAFNLHDLSTAQHCSDALANLSAHLSAVGGDPTAKHEGIDLSAYVASLRELVGDSEDMSADEVIQFIDRVLDEYMEENDIEDDDSGLSTAASADVSTTDPPAPPAQGADTQPAAQTAASTEGASMASPATSEVTETPANAATQDPTAAAETTTTTTTTAETAASATEPPPVVEPPPAVTETPKDKEPVATPDSSALSLELLQERAKNAELEAKLQALQATGVPPQKTPEQIEAEQAAHEQALSAEVDCAIRIYGVKKGVNETHKTHMLSVLRSNPEAFRSLYPPVNPGQEHMLSNLTGGGASDPNNPGARTPADTAAPIEEAEPPSLKEAKAVIALGLDGLTNVLQSQLGLPFTLAQIKADEKLNEARRVINALK